MFNWVVRHRTDATGFTSTEILTGDTATRIPGYHARADAIHMLKQWRKRVKEGLK